MKKLLTKDDILNCQDLKTKEIDVPEWGGTVRVSQISAAARCDLQMMVLDDNGKPKSGKEINRILTLGLCAFSVVDENGAQLFTEAEIEALSKKNADAVDRVFAVADELNGISLKMHESIKKK